VRSGPVVERGAKAVRNESNRRLVTPPPSEKESHLRRHSAGSFSGAPSSARAASPRLPRLEIRLLGHVEVLADGVPFPLATPRKTLALLTFLLLNRTSRVARDFLTFQLWPDEEEEIGRQRLRANLHDLQKIMPEPRDAWITGADSVLAWNPQAEVWLDVEAFEAASGDEARLREAAGLYRGDLVTAIYDEWIVAPRERLQQRYLRVLGELMREARRRQAYGQVGESLTYGFPFGGRRVNGSVVGGFELQLSATNSNAHSSSTGGYDEELSGILSYHLTPHVAIGLRPEFDWHGDAVSANRHKASALRLRIDLTQ